MNFTHGDNRRAKRAPEYYSWMNMKARCLNPNVENYPRYGGRRVKICPQWQDSYSQFLLDMGRRPTKSHSLDRINNAGNYTPSNCRWATPKEQGQNKRSIKLTAEDVLQIRANAGSSTHQRIADHFGVSRSLISQIIRGERHSSATQ